MNEQSAREQGLYFTGIYSSNKEEVKTRIAEIKEKYPLCRIRLVNVPHSKLSRSGPGMGYSAHADEVYSAYKTYEETRTKIAQHQSNLDLLKAEYERKVAEEITSFEALKFNNTKASQIITKAQNA